MSGGAKNAASSFRSCKQSIKLKSKSKVLPKLDGNLTFCLKYTDLQTSLHVGA